MKKTAPPAVEKGQLWVDNDKRLRNPKRFIRVMEFDQDSAVCEAWRDTPGSVSRTVRIRLLRFRPTSTGYRPATADEIRSVVAEAQS
jgi:hypothetical protein